MFRNHTTEKLKIAHHREANGYKGVMKKKKSKIPDAILQGKERTEQMKIGHHRTALCAVADVDLVQPILIFLSATVTSFIDILRSGESLEQSKPTSNIGERKSWTLQAEEEAPSSSCSSTTESSSVGNA